MAPCPCGSGAELDDCCGPIILGHTAAPTAEALMRSRYTAFARGDLDHIQRTYARKKRGNSTRGAAQNSADSVQWTGLEILGTWRGSKDDDAGTVEFAARYTHHGTVGVHRERSSFRREDGLWVYVDGDIAPHAGPGQSAKVGRNQPCPCGSGKKFKKCCGV